MFDRRHDRHDLRTSIERMTELWFGHRGPWHGIAADKLAATRLPAPLRWLYGFAGEWPSNNAWESVFAYQDLLLPFETLFMDDGKLVFVSENQGVWLVGTLPDGDDPPVWVRENEPESPWYKLCDSLTEFLVTFCLHEIVFGARYRAHGKNLLDRFRSHGCHISPMWLDGPYVGHGQTFEDCVDHTISFHMVDGKLLVMDDGWCGTSMDEPWIRFPDLFKIPDPPSPGYDSLAPLPEHLAVPSFIRKSHLENLVRRHATQAEFHQKKIAQYRSMLEEM